MLNEHSNNPTQSPSTVPALGESALVSGEAIGTVTQVGGTTVTISVATDLSSPIRVGDLLAIPRCRSCESRGSTFQRYTEPERALSSNLPILSPGEALVLGVDFPTPLRLQVERPSAPPASTGPDYQASWGTSTVSTLQ